MADPTPVKTVATPGLGAQDVILRMQDLYPGRISAPWIKVFFVCMTVARKPTGQIQANSAYFLNKSC
ncbi:MAG: hypothetical protein CXR31_12395 [Geobacter sp.]|nr:MAG: hypothetical protein CXR31_12395 [Geobacter sp.]